MRSFVIICLQLKAQVFARHEFALLRREEQWALLVRIRSSSAESGRSPPPLCFAAWPRVTPSFAQVGFPSVSIWEFRQQSEWMLEHSQIQIRPLRWIAKEADYLVPQQ